MKEYVSFPRTLPRLVSPSAGRLRWLYLGRGENVIISGGDVCAYRFTTLFVCLFVCWHYLLGWVPGIPKYVYGMFVTQGLEGREKREISASPFLDTLPLENTEAPGLVNKRI